MIDLYKLQNFDNQFISLLPQFRNLYKENELKR